MDIARTYSEEKLLSLFSKMADQNEKTFDIVQLLLLSADDSEKRQKELQKGQKEIITRILDIEQSVTNMDSKLDNILEKISAIENDFADVK